MASQLSIRGLFRPLTNNSMRSLMMTTTLPSSSSSSSAPSPSTVPLFLGKKPTTTTTTTTRKSPIITTTSTTMRTFTTTPVFSASKPAAKGGKTPNKTKKEDMSAKGRKARRQAASAKLDPKTANIMKFLYAGSQVRAPLRMARNRHLRHWTIHRAWLLFRRKREEKRERELMRLHASMKYACETLRNLEGPGTRPKGYLFRKSMEKIGLWGQEAVPIEYARPMVDTPPEKAWNHEWKRPSWWKK